MTTPLDPQFDARCERFTRRMRAVADWKNYYFGAAYSTRIELAIEEAIEAIQEMRQSSEIKS